MSTYLSGGIDSSVVAFRIMKFKTLYAKLTAFTISFAESDNEELEIAERTAEFCGIDLKKLILTEEEFVQNFDEAIWLFEQPQPS